jgi:hypothetical protein
MAEPETYSRIAQDVRSPPSFRLAIRPEEPVGADVGAVRGGDGTARHVRTASNLNGPEADGGSWPTDMY